jgi:hypothetical protein
MPPKTETTTESTAPDEQQRLARAIKFVGPDLIEGPAFLFNPDITGEQFTPETDLCIEWFGKSGRPLLYEHGVDGAMKAGLIGRQTDYDVRDEGVWAQSQLDRSARYRKAIDSLIERGALAYSGGAMAHLATKSAAGAIKRFPWVELSLTPTPANPANASVYYLKSLDAVAHLEAADVELPDPLKAALTALDEWADSRDATPVSERLADRLDRVSTELEGLHEHVREYAAMRVKSGRSLSAETRGRLTVHPASLRELAEALDGLLADPTATKSYDFLDSFIQAETAIARRLGVPIEEIPS